MQRYRSKFEAAIAASSGPKARYEVARISYKKECHYTPDWTLPNGIHVEAKGRFSPEDRSKLLAVKAQHPTLDIRLLFQRACNRLSRSSKTTYSEWAEKHGFKWAEGSTIPPEWF